MRTIALPLAAASLLALAACSKSPDESTTAPATPASTAPASATPEPTPGETPLARKTLTLEGLGGLTIGQPVPAGSTFASRGAQLDNGCEILSSPDYPNVYAMVEQGAVRRITVSEGSTVKLEEGIGSGSSLSDVKAAFPGFVETPHKYTEGKYLTQPGKDPRLMFEISPEGKVTEMHVGTMPQLAYVEGCA